jgi:hypothetical protein
MNRAHVKAAFAQGYGQPPQAQYYQPPQNPQNPYYQ